MRILVTGTGSRLAHAAIAALPAGTNVRVLDPDPSGQALPPLCERLPGPLTDSDAVARAVDGVEAILHLAPIAPAAASDAPGADLAALEEATRGTYLLMCGASEAGVRRVILGSTLELFDTLPHHWFVTERWSPRPRPMLTHLRAWLTELSARQASLPGSHASRERQRATFWRPPSVICLRFGRVVEPAEVAGAPFDPRWLATEDAVRGILCALRYERPGWSVFHIAAAGPHARPRLFAAGRPEFGYRPEHDFADRPVAASRLVRTPRQVEDSGVPNLFGPYSGQPLPPAEYAAIPSRPIRRVVIFGAGGPMAAATVAELAPVYTLRLADLRPLAEIAAAGPRSDQGPGAPIPTVPLPPHESIVCDVTDEDAVMNACVGMDAVINCSVIRWKPDLAFGVNTLGVYNIVRACVAHRIRRFVQTGPQMITLGTGVDYLGDFDIGDNAPLRPARHLYGHSKYLGQELGRVYAEAYGLEMPVLLYNNLRALGVPQPVLLDGYCISWGDAARAIRSALEVAALPSPYEVFNINANLPHGEVSNEKARRILGWAPQDDLAEYWSE